MKTGRADEPLTSATRMSNAMAWSRLRLRHGLPQPAPTHGSGIRGPIVPSGQRRTLQGDAPLAARS